MPSHHNGNVRILKIQMDPYDNNAYVVICTETNEGIIIDAPGEPYKLFRELGDTKIQAILITHSHPDHILGIQEFRTVLKSPILIHPEDADRLPFPPDGMLEDNMTISFGKHQMRAIHTPGHTPGGTCFLLGQHLFSGDTLFPGGPGNTRSPKDFQQIVDSITNRLLVLPIETIAYPGHGLDTDVEKARQEYAAFASRPHAEDLCGAIKWLES